MICTERTDPLSHSARTVISPPGASKTSSVTGSSIGRIPVSSRTVATHIEFEPDIGGKNSASIIMNAASASG